MKENESRFVSHHPNLAFKTLKIGIAEDHSMFRSGLASVINSHENLKVIIEAVNGYDLIHKCADDLPDIVFMDYRMPELNGIDATRVLRDQAPTVKVIMLSLYMTEDYVINAIGSGAVGYLRKDQDAQEIFNAIQSVQNIGYYLNDLTSKSLIQNLVSQGDIDPKFFVNPNSLSKNERKVVQLMGKEYTTKEIAKEIGKGIRTIEGYKKRIMDKTGARNSCGIIMYGVKNGIICLN